MLTALFPPAFGTSEWWAARTLCASLLWGAVEDQGNRGDALSRGQPWKNSLSSRLKRLLHLPTSLCLSLGHPVSRVASGAHSFLLLVTGASGMLSVATPPQHIGFSWGQAGSEGGINFFKVLNFVSKGFLCL